MSIARGIRGLVFVALLASGPATAWEPQRHGGESACTVVAGPEAPEDEGKDPGACPTALRAATPVAPLGPDAPGDTDVTHYFLDIEIIPEYAGSAVSSVRVEGISTIDFQPTVDGLSHFTVDLHAPLSVNAVTGDVASWTRVGDAIEIDLDRAYDAGEAVQVAVDYAGYPQSAGLGAFRWWIRGGNLVVATLSEPFYARYWWPCKDALDDKATMDMHVTVPSGMVALSNGADLGSQPLSGNRTRHLWQETHPMIPYLASLAITSYERYDLQYDYDDGGVPRSMPVPCYVYPDHWDAGAGEPDPPQKAGCDELPGMLETFASLFGEYPFADEKYGVVETGGFGGLGANMEHQTLSSMYRVHGYSDIMAHELGHQWWGDEVTCQTWYDIWLNEGFATYSEALYREFKAGGSVSDFWSRVNYRKPSNPDAQVYRTDVSTVGGIFNTNAVYEKGTWVLHMLRRVMGDAAFFAALADYRAAFADDSATTTEFSDAISASFGEDLSWFVEQWVLNPGSPDYEWNYTSENIGGQEYLKLAIWQTQDGDGYDLFTMPIEVHVTTLSGFSVHRVWNDDWSETYVIPVDGPPLLVQLDTDDGIANRNWVLWDSMARVATAVAAAPVLVSVATDATSIALTFSEDIGSFDAADFLLTRAGGGVVPPLSVGYDAASKTATLEFQDLATGEYALAVFDESITANGKLLDGEADADAWWDDRELPSGDGVPGGDALIAFGEPVASQVPLLGAPGLLGLSGLLVASGAALLRSRRAGGGAGRSRAPTPRRDDRTSGRASRGSARYRDRAGRPIRRPTRPA